MVASTMPLLARYVERVVVLAPPACTDLHIDHIPDGTTNLVVRWLGDDRVIAGVRGPATRAIHKTVRAAPLAIQVAFRPGCSYPFFGVPVDELRDRAVDLAELWKDDVGPFTSALSESARRRGDVIAVVESALVGRLRMALFEPAGAMIARAAVARISAGGGSIERIARDLDVSPRSLRRAFHETVGLAPKMYARITRLQRALVQRRNASRWTDVARAAGYADQAHMSREFRELTSGPPSANHLARTFCAR